MKKYALVLLFLVFAHPGRSAPPSQTAEHAEVPVTYAMDYLLYLPEGAEKADAKRWPLVVFLHGMGARGTDLDRVRREGLASQVEQGRKFPFIVVSPQCPPDIWWDLPAVEALIEHLCARLPVDRDRIYLTGLSMGGFATWALAQRKPGFYAAAVPIAGGGEVKWAPRLTGLPIWAFHGAQDRTVPVRRSEEMVAAINEAGGQARLTIDPDGGHNVWDAAYNGEELFTWLLAQNRRSREAEAKAR